MFGQVLLNLFHSRGSGCFGCADGSRTGAEDVTLGLLFLGGNCVSKNLVVKTDPCFNCKKQGMCQDLGSTLSQQRTSWMALEIAKVLCCGGFEDERNQCK